MSYVQPRQNEDIPRFGDLPMSLFSCPPGLLPWMMGGFLGGFIGVVGGAWTMRWYLQNVTIQRDEHSQARSE